MSVLRRAKLRTPDGIESIEYPLGVEAENVEVANQENLSQRLVRIDEDLEKNEEDIAAVSELAGTNKQNIGANEIRIDALERRSASVDKKPYYFNTVADMKAYQKLIEGDMVITLGYYEANDGGGAEYIIVDGSYTDDEGNYHELNNGLFAELIIKGNEVNVKCFGAKGDGNHDDTENINNALKTPGNLVLYFPKGTYNHTGLIIKKSINIIGENKYSTKLLNIGSGNSITINERIERGNIENISIFGNNTTAKKGFVFSNGTVHWTFNNIWMRNHTEEFFYACNTGHVNNIIIKNSEFEYGKSSCMKFYQNNYSNQINAITISDCNISGFVNGIEAWGQSIKILNNSIQACSNCGILLKGNSEDAAALGHLQGCVITGNYFELCNNGFIYAETSITPYARYISGLVILGNYGNYEKLNNDFDNSNTYLVSLISTDYDFAIRTLSGVFYMSNAFAKGSAKGILTGNTRLASSNIINNTSVGNNTAIEQAFSYADLGHAQTQGFHYNPLKILYGKIHCLSHSYDLSNSENITANTTVYFDFPIDLLKLQRISFTCTTDCTNYTIQIIKRSNNTDTALATINGNGNQDMGHNFTTFKHLNDLDNLIDCIGIKIQFNTSVTNFNLSNIKYRLHD